MSQGFTNMGATGFGTSISGWVVPIDALDPFQVAPTHDHSGDTFDHLTWKDKNTGTFDMKLKATVIRRQPLCIHTILC